MSTLILDIETVGEDFDTLDPTTQEMLTRWLKKESYSEDEYERKLDDIKNGLGFSPLTGQVVVIGVLDHHRSKSVVYYQAPEMNFSDKEEGSVTYKCRTEKEMLEQFWQGAANYTEFVTFNGREFDIPFLMIRSAINKVRPTKNLLSNRYLSSQIYDAKHVDLCDQLSFYGSVRKKCSLHVSCRAFGVESPKAQGVSGDDVAGLFKEKKYFEIAEYNVGDLVATQKLYEYWKEFLS
jgi:predicted PolB exonuclease-like 3'-5' exonuclease